MATTDTPIGSPARGFDSEDYAPIWMGIAIVLLLGSLSIATSWTALAGITILALLVMACWSRREGFLLFGPVFLLELRQIVRKKSVIRNRALYVGMILFIFSMFYYSLVERYELQWWKAAELSIAESAEFATSIVYSYLGAQTVFLVMTTPLLLGSVIAEEKDRRSIDFLLMTDLRSREITLGKSASRMVYVFCYVLAGIPVLAIIPLLGGVDYSLVLLALLSSLLMVLGAAGVTIWISVHAPTASKATQRASATVVGYFVIFPMLIGAITQYPNVIMFPVTYWPECPISVGTLLQWFSFGNPFVRLDELRIALDPSVPGAKTLESVFREFAIFHLGIFLILGSWGIRRLRPICANYADGVPAKPNKQVVSDRSRPQIGNYPILWKERYYDSRQAKTIVGKLGWLLTLGVGIVMPMFIIWYATAYELDRYELASMNLNVRIIGALVLFFAFTSAGSHAANTLDRERKRNTLESLLLVGLSAREILWQKWVGSAISIRYLLMLAGLCYGALFLVGALSFLGLIFWLISVVIFLLAQVSFGIWCAVTFPQPNKAGKTYPALGYAPIICSAVIAIFTCCLAIGGSPRVGLEEILIFLAVATQPIAIMGIVPFSEMSLDDFFRNTYNHSEAIAMALGCFTGWLLFAVAGAECMRQALVRFERMRGEHASRSAESAQLSDGIWEQFNPRGKSRASDDDAPPADKSGLKPENLELDFGPSQESPPRDKREEG
ncbi:ABC transporter permease subunit [Tuwongella immobilis]|uniref:ABC-2 type transporter domain-containing protein n=1 Tax=Tuwongella immobilis TaxID=692036 RepID=A0A6C2YLB5_9BACT|nr:ABC transporter permease subunit [Tuwongella immobilis]VIP01895.1 Uncharacterized protein OS=Singulisphaera acidiphila (strain ATCC BAA-1392 / DSM 18658 / VKM B-2454 / MOB10) GN=Sinac_6371 PE=4 SV=1: ABC2_membrane_2 [Tuwongella immobilis]VTR99773.1 Uncharacterized protein OS=Singulisphaera acidiphila (strain ATCC BAA-1392 / DSM 18658 / VKM B-2454 / MOB10) GN=Sinac_6371 PE=4 SV=1: ABC2_membrane_2 [Tuwongella immobilis]